MLERLRIILMFFYWCDYVPIENDSSCFAFLTLISWFCLLKYLKIFNGLRVFIQIMIDCITEAVSFTIALIVMFLSFACAQYANTRFDEIDHDSLTFG